MTPLSAADPAATWAVVWFLGVTADPNGRWVVSSHGISYWATEDEARAYAAKRTGHPKPDSIAIPLALIEGDSADSIALRAARQVGAP